jgi:hypothetical protein
MGLEPFEVLTSREAMLYHLSNTSLVVRDRVDQHICNQLQHSSTIKACGCLSLNMSTTELIIFNSSSFLFLESRCSIEATIHHSLSAPHSLTSLSHKGQLILLYEKYLFNQGLPFHYPTIVVYLRMTFWLTTDYRYESGLIRLSWSWTVSWPRDAVDIKVSQVMHYYMFVVMLTQTTSSLSGKTVQHTQLSCIVHNTR